MILLLAALVCLGGPSNERSLSDPSRVEVQNALRQAIGFFREKVAVEGGYVYRVSADLKLREGEDEAGATRVWVQPPGTPAVGEAFLDAYHATGEPYHLEAALDAARCLRRGQLVSGGWGYFIEFDPAERPRFAYRVDGKPREKAVNRSTLDDDTTQAALRFLLRLTSLLPEAHPDRAATLEAARYGLTALLRTQYPNGGWNVSWTEYPRERPSPGNFPVRPASFPETWERTWKKDFPGRYVTNDGLMDDMIDLMLLAHEVTGDTSSRDAARRAGDFLILAQMPDPQPAWAQQYDVAMHPCWARKFEPPAISGGESQGILSALIRLARATGDPKYLEPVPRALGYLRASTLADGRLARFYELRTNRPLYFNRSYELTYTPDDLPTHYAFLVGAQLDAIERQYERAREALSSPAKEPSAPAPATARVRRVSEPPPRERVASVRRVLDALDDRGAWAEPGNMRGFNKATPPGGILSSETFIRNVAELCDYLSHRLPGDPEGSDGR